MQYDPILNQGHELLKVGNPSIFKNYLLRHLQRELATDHGFLNPSLRIRAQLPVAKSQQSVSYWANLLFLLLILCFYGQPA